MPRDFVKTRNYFYKQALYDNFSDKFFKLLAKVIMQFHSSKSLENEWEVSRISNDDQWKFQVNMKNGFIVGLY